MPYPTTSEALARLMSDRASRNQGCIDMDNKPNLNNLLEKVDRLLKEAEQLAQAAEDLVPGRLVRADGLDTDRLAEYIDRNVRAALVATQTAQRVALAPKSEPEDILAEARKSIGEMAIRARRVAEEHRKRLLAAEESLRIARQGLACPDGNPEAVATLAGAISALADSVEALLSAMKASE